MRKNIGIDLGSASVLMYLSDTGKIIEEPAVLAVREENGEILAAGGEAKTLCGRIPGAAKILRPFRSGVDIGGEYFEYYMKYILKKADIKGILHPNLLMCVSGNVSDADEDRIYDIVHRLGVRDVMVVGRMSAAAAGAGIDPSSHEFSLIADIGGSRCEIAVISLGESVDEDVINVGGSSLDTAIASYMANEHNLRINQTEAERLKKDLGGVWKRDSIISSDAVGVNITDGLPNSVSVSSKEIFTAIAPEIKKLAVGIRKFISGLSDEEKVDIKKNGAVLTGGGSLLYGLPRLLGEATGIEFTMAKEPYASIALGFENLIKEM